MNRLLWFCLILGIASPTLAQRDALIGTWENSSVDEEGLAITLRLDLKSNGEFALSLLSLQSREQFFQGIQEDGQDSVATEDGEASLGLRRLNVAAKLLRPSTATQEDSLFALLDSTDLAALLIPFLIETFPDTMAIAVKVTGTWESDETALRLDAQASQVLINDLEPREFMEQLAKALAQGLASQLEVPEEDYPAFEIQIVEAFTAGTGEEFSVEFDPDEVDLDGTYLLQDDALFITDEEGEITRFEQVLISAVAPTSWGQIKAAMP